MKPGRPRKPTAIRSGKKLTPLSHRLRTVMEQGNMTVQALAWFFDRPYQTVYTWAYRNREPAPYYVNDVLLRLDELEKLFKSSEHRGKPLFPRGLTAKEREEHVQRLLTAAGLTFGAATA